MTTKNFIAAGNFANQPGEQLIAVPGTYDELLEKLVDVFNRNKTGAVLNADDYNILKAYLPAVGCDEALYGEDGALNGTTVIDNTFEGAGLQVKAQGKVGVTSRWETEHERKEWNANLEIQKAGGTARALEIAFTFRFVSVGANDEGQPEIIFNANYSRVFSDPRTLSGFNSGEPFAASRFEISKHMQWGYFVSAKCEIRTEQGTLKI